MLFCHCTSSVRKFAVKYHLKSSLNLIGAQIILSSSSDYSSNEACATVGDGGNVDQPVVDTCGGSEGQFLTVVHANDYITIC